MDTGEFCVKSGSVNCVTVMFISCLYKGQNCGNSAYHLNSSMVDLSVNNKSKQSKLNIFMYYSHQKC